jgi:hypothetical protein
MKGIDVEINRIKTYMSAKLWTDKTVTFNGRIFRNVKNGETNPETFVNGIDYTDVLLDDTKDAICFFDVQPTETFEGNFTADVWVCFAVNLARLYPSITTERATEYAHEDVVKVVRRMCDITGLVRGYPAFSDYSRVKEIDNFHPFYLFRLNTKIKYKKVC